jgi:hypothetical protein
MHGRWVPAAALYIYTYAWTDLAHRCVVCV